MQGELRSNPFMPGGNKRSTYLNKPAIVTVCDREIHKNTEKWILKILGNMNSTLQMTLDPAY